MNVIDILKLIDDELAFYRKRQFAIYVAALTTELAVITGKATLPGDKGIWEAVAYTLVFIGIPIATFFFSDSYRCRIYELRKSKNKLLSDEDKKYKDLFPEPSELGRRERLLSKSPSIQYVYVVTAVSFLGIVLTWVGLK